MSLLRATHDSIDIESLQASRNLLPSHLEAELILKKNESEMDKSTRRSLYMAGFLKGFAEAGQFKKIPFFMGFAHMSQVKGFLMDSTSKAKNTKAFQRGIELGSELAQRILNARENQEDPTRILDNNNYPMWGRENFLRAVNASLFSTRLGQLSSLVMVVVFLYFGPNHEFRFN